ncbi:ABC transporter ATP-binding protein [Mycoplasma sp. 888]|uniref:ABC transporter ATP-binding protein n=1 Tax=Mycoplasma sp. 888 TaxID=3108483 RepID=UPI002D79A96D|nr:ABC transporter ATP-binding protein [Mycoplasma sp. 888]WRQ26005.1 ABC transporter ATP-binding protein [Mycoplasma sp. 888]
MKKDYYIETQKKFLFWKKEFIRYNIKGVDEMLKVPQGKEVLATLRNVDVTYGSRSKAFRAVVDFNLNIYKGEVLGIVGESGSGKSTIGRAIIGLTPHSFGQIKILDKLLPKKMVRGFKFGKSLKEYKQIVNFMINKVQMIFQDPANSLNPHVNIETVVSEGLTNTKNSKEIYLFNYDQEVVKHLYSMIDKKEYRSLFGKFKEELDHKISINENIAYDALYVDFEKTINQTWGLSEVADKLVEYKKKREELNKLTENECKTILVKDILKSVGLDESVLKRYPLEFSGGQQQRIGISRAVVLRPTLLIADEPISALDVSIQAQVVNIFNELKEKYNLTIVFIAHDLRMVEYISDRIAVMNKGRLLEVGTTEEIMKHSLHPYTKSLLESVPSIDSDKGSLLGYEYNPAMHNYTEDYQPEWIKINDNHFVLATPKEVQDWKNNIY